MESISRLEKLFWVLLEEARRNPELAERIAFAIGAAGSEAEAGPRPPSAAGSGSVSRPAAPARSYTPEPAPAPVRVPAARRPQAFDPFGVYDLGWEAMLRERLTSLSVDQLKDMVVANGWDRGSGALEWSQAEKLRDLIVKRVVAKSAL